MIEIELKFEIKNIKKIINQLLKLGFKQTKKRTLEKTVMFDNPQGLMQTTDGRIRLRQGGKKIELSYKKPITRNGIKKELEYETEVSYFGETKKILEMMEFTPTTSYERYRTEFEKDGLKATIDEFPFAVFLELEGPENGIKKVAKAMDFDLKNNLTDSCDTIFTKRRLAKGLKPINHIKFDNNKNKQAS